MGLSSMCHKEPDEIFWSADTISVAPTPDVPIIGMHFILAFNCYFVEFKYLSLCINYGAFIS